MRTLDQQTRKMIIDIRASITLMDEISLWYTGQYDFDQDEDDPCLYRKMNDKSVTLRLPEPILFCLDLPEWRILELLDRGYTKEDILEDRKNKQRHLMAVVEIWRAGKDSMELKEVGVDGESTRKEFKLVKVAK